MSGGWRGGLVRSSGLWVLRRGSGRFGDWKGDVAEKSDGNALQGGDDDRMGCGKTGLAQRMIEQFRRGTRAHLLPVIYCMW